MLSTNSRLILVASHPFFSSNIKKTNVNPYNRKSLKLERYKVSKLSILASLRVLIYLRNKIPTLRTVVCHTQNQHFIFAFKVLC